MVKAAKVLPLEEYRPATFQRGQIPDDVARTLLPRFGNQVSVQLLWQEPDQPWQLTSLGWVGYIPLTPDLALDLKPKVKLQNLFGMFEYAYRLKAFKFPDGLVDCQSLQEFYEQLAHVLARRVLDRGRKGLYRAYLSENERLPYVRGRIDLRSSARKPWAVDLECHYEDHAADIVENQILAWTLLRIVHSGLCSERVLPTIRHAFRALRAAVSVQPFRPRDCVGRLYNRLNDDYHPLHALCRFFLEHSGPSHQVGDHTMLPFLVDMESLFEMFVAEWLRAHLPANVLLKVQETVHIGEGDSLKLVMDLMLYDAQTGQPYCVLDTKYKKKAQPEADDVTQVIAYAHVKDCRRAVLVYPAPLDQPLDESIRGIRVQSMTFSIAGDLEDAGQDFLRTLASSGKPVIDMV